MLAGLVPLRERSPAGLFAHSRSISGRAIAFFNVGCRRVFETHLFIEVTVRLEDSTAPYELPIFKKALALEFGEPVLSDLNFPVTLRLARR